MGISKLKLLKRVFYFFALAALMLNVIITILFNDTDISAIHKNLEPIPVDLYSDKELTQPVHLPFNNNGSSDIFELYFKLPRVKDNNVIQIMSHYDSLTADMDGIHFYASQYSHLGFLKTYAGRIFCFIPVTPECSGKTVTLHIGLQKNFYKKNVSVVQITTISTYIQSAIKKCLPSYFLAFLILVSSLITFNTFCMSYIFRRQRNKKELHTFISTLGVSLCVVVWIFTNYDVVGLILGNNASLALINYLAFTILPVCFSNFLHSIFNSKSKVISFLTVLSCMNLLFQLIFFMFGLFDFTQMLFVTHIIDVLNIFVTIVVIFDFKTLRNFNLEQKVLCVGCAFLGVFCILGLLMYIVDSSTNFMLFITLGIFIFFGMHMITTVLRLFQSLKEHAVLLESERNSYKDQLTTLGNRRLYLQKLGKLETVGIGENLNFIMFDVNGLKTINDSLGHDAGDELLRGTAVCLQESFPDADVLCRMGGDEFFMLLNENENVLERRLKRFLNYTKNFNGPIIKSISIAYGISNLRKYPGATSGELEKYADEEMYKNKSEYYKNTDMDRRRK